MFREAGKAASLLRPISTGADRPAQRSKNWVVLGSSRIAFEANGLRRRLESMFRDQFLPERADGSFVVGGPTPDPVLIKSLVPGASGLFMLMACNGPYIDVNRAAKRDIELARLVGAHRAWMSIDLIAEFENSNPYAFIGQVVAELAPPDATVLIHPGCRIAMPLDVGVRQRLRAGLTPDDVEIAT